MSYIRKDDYSQERERPNLFSNYLEKMVKYLKIKFPHKSDSELEAFVKSVVRQRAKAPIVEAVVHKREGNNEHVEMKLDKFIREVISDNNLAPSGSCYLRIEKRESFLRRSIADKIKQRNDYKKLYLEYEAQGKKRESQFYNQKQANAKIFNNAIAGGMRIEQFILGSLAGFNAITSVGRISVKQGYSIIERAVNGNIYLPSQADAISYVLNHVSHIPRDFLNLVEDRVIYIPTKEDVVSYLGKCVENYKLNPDLSNLIRVVDGLSDCELAYVFYAGCFSNLCKYNDNLIRTWIDSCFYSGEVSDNDILDIDVSEIKTFKDDVLACMLSTKYHLLGKKEGDDNKWNSVKDALKKNPDGVKRFIYTCRVFVENFEKLLYILRPIFRIETTFSRLTLQHRIARETVPLSDTDSNIFSNQELIKWKRGRVDFSQESYEMNAIVTFILSQSLEHVFARLSSGLGIAQKDVFRISMKNEFLYPIILVTSLGKHYLAIATMQEGNLLPNPRKDIKGVGFRSSAYPKTIRDGFDKFVVDLFKEIEKGEPISASYVLDHVVSIEREIYKSVSNRDHEFLQTQSVKRKDDYAEPMSSAYFYYEMWSEVFSEEFGEMTIPNKCFKIPIKKNGKIFRDPAFMEYIEKEYPTIHKNLIVFLEKYPKRDFGYILIPPFKGKFHKFFVEIIDIRAHISQVTTAYYHMLNALGIGTIDKRSDALISDFYDPSKPLIQ